MAMESVPVTVDRSHLIVIGEKLYARSLKLVRELVNNAYDADAAEVSVEVGSDEVVVQDDGLGGWRLDFGPGGSRRISTSASA
jgi:hypothetical protein